jgi:hypothetical protein
MSTNGNTEIDKRLCFGERLAVRAIEDLVRQAQDSNQPLRQRNSLSRGPVGCMPGLSTSYGPNVQQRTSTRPSRSCATYRSSGNR